MAHKFQDAGKEPGLFIWRIDNKSQEISVVGKGTHGLFRSDDCYLILHSQMADSGNLSHTIYIWIGKSTNQENFASEQLQALEERCGECTAAREVQEHESSVFLSFFKQGIRYVEPLHLKEQVNLREEDHATKLYHLKGRRNIRVKQVELSVKALNKGDVFILDADTVIYQWNGHGASRMEKAKALDLTVRLRDERMNRLKAEVVIIDDGKENDAFWEALGGKGEIKDEVSGGDDVEFEEQYSKETKLYRVSDASGSIQITEVDLGGKPLDRSHLDTNDCFILDCVTEIFVWTGRKSTAQEKSESMNIAKKFLQDFKRPNWTPITKLSEGVENALFKAKFRGNFKEYIDTPENFSKRIEKSHKLAGTLAQEKVNIDALHHPEKYQIAHEELVDTVPSKDPELESELEIWFIKDSKIHSLPMEEYGLFQSGNSYIIHFSVHLRGGGYRHVVYNWQGRDSSQDDKGAGSLLSSDYANKFGRSASQIRVIQNKEPDHFLSHFEGTFILRKGSRDEWASDKPSKVLFQLRGTNEVNTRAIQVESVATSLNSNDAFVLDLPDKAFTWIGKGANKFERSMATGLIAQRAIANANKPVTVVEEGSEDEEFWSALGGKQAYSNEPYLAAHDIKARLFQCSDRTGVFKVFEIHNFSQDDLDIDDVMLLDAFDVVFVWVGSKSTQNEKDMGMNTAMDYIRYADDGRTVETCPLVLCHEGNETPQFTAHFHGWDPKKSGQDPWTRKLAEIKHFSTQLINVDPALVEEVKKEMEGTKASEAPKENARPMPTGSITTTDKKVSETADGSLVFDFDRLKVKPYPDGVDPERLEDFISEEEFEKRFKMKRAAFKAFPKWKQLRVKKDAGLF